MNGKAGYKYLHTGLLLFLFLSLLVCSSASAEPLSIRNNNAGNIKYVPSNDWVGQLGSNKGFVVFDTKEHGLRATKLVIKANIRATRSVHCFVLRYASQPNESMANKHIQNYANAITKLLGRDYILESDIDKLTPLIVKLEGGQEASDYFYPKPSIKDTPTLKLLFLSNIMHTLKDNNMQLVAKKMRTFDTKSPAKSYTGTKFKRYTVAVDGTVTPCS